MLSYVLQRKLNSLIWLYFEEFCQFKYPLQTDKLDHITFDVVIVSETKSLYLCYVSNLYSAVFLALMIFMLVPCSTE